MLLRNGGICSNTSDEMVVGSQQKCTCGSFGVKFSQGNGTHSRQLSRERLKFVEKQRARKSQWLLRDQNDPDAGYSISQWESEEDMRVFWESKQRSDAMAVIQPFFVNQFTITTCEVRVAV